MATYAYCRVSTDRQADEGESLGAQQRTVEGYALMHGMDMDHVFIERGVSGSKPLADRPEGAKLLEALKPGDTIITPKLDRMFRSATDALNVCDRMKAQGIALHMIDLGGDVTSNGVSKLVFTILSAVAEAERDRIRERIRDVKADQKARNRYLGGTLPFGWCLGKDGDLVTIEAQQSAIRRIMELRRADKSLRAISEAMKSEGFTISHAGVKKVITAEIERIKKEDEERGVIDMSFAVQQGDLMEKAIAEGTWPHLDNSPEGKILQAKARVEAQYRQARNASLKAEWDSVDEGGE